MNDRVVRWALRSVAIVIAIAAFIDPVVTSERAERPTVVVTGEGAADSAVLATVSRELSKDFTVLPSAFDNAAATVVVGSRVPLGSRQITQPAFVVMPVRVGPHVALATLRAPTRAPLNVQVPLLAFVDASRAKGMTVEAELAVNGAVVDRGSSVVPSGDAHIELPLSFLPTSVGVASLRVTTRIAGGASVSSADYVIDVVDKKFAVLVYDPRPSWMSTFVRRALERDPRFVITSRTVTSSSVSTDAGRPPASLGDAPVLETFDAIVVGAPDALSESDVRGLNQFLRRRGGGVALLFDDKKGGQYGSLTGFTAWTSATGSTPTTIPADRGDSVAMRATEWMWPIRTPDNATVIAWSSAKREHPSVFQIPVGAGRLLISGALDAWKFRDPAQSSFERFWQANIGDLADASAAAVELRVPTTPVMRGSRVDISVVSRTASLAPLSGDHAVGASASASLQTSVGLEFVRLWPTGSAGTFSGTFHAPDSVGIYHVSATADGVSAAAAIIVASVPPELPLREDTSALSAWAASGGGKLFTSNQANLLPGALRNALRPALRRVAWHPMRSPWWLAGFVLALSVEWWLRRRRGLP